MSAALGAGMKLLVNVVNHWLEQRAWKELELFLIERYPQHREVIALWLEGSQARAEANEPITALRAVST